MDETLHLRYISRYLIDENSYGVNYEIKDARVEISPELAVIFNICGDEYEGKEHGFLCLSVVLRDSNGPLIDLYKKQNNYSAEEQKQLNEIALKKSNFLQKEADRVVKVFRWLVDLPFNIDKRGKNVELHWSYNKSRWEKVPQNVEPSYSIIGLYGGSATDVVNNELIKSIIAANINQEEPLAHDILLEAFTLMNNGNLRAAYVLGYSALEVGVKHYIQKKAPMTSWLIDNMPSPDMSRICLKYLPTIDSGIDISNSPEKKLIELHMQGRNKLIHSGTFNENFISVNQKLNAVKAMLHRLDYSMGLVPAKVHLDKTLISIGDKVVTAKES